VTDPIDRPYSESVEPGAAQDGLDAPGFLAAVSDVIQYGVYNGGFRVGPPDPSLDVDPAPTTASSNFVPGWRFVQSSNTNVTASFVRSTVSASGSNFRFTFDNTGSATDEAYLEQLVDVGGSSTATFADSLFAASATSVGGAPYPTLQLRAQYLDVDGTIIGAESTSSATLWTTGEPRTSLITMRPAPRRARWLRMRYVAARGSVSTGTSFTVDVYEMRRDRSVRSMPVMSSRGDPGDDQVVTLRQDYPGRLAAGNGTTSHMLSGSLIAVPFVLLNIPSGATTDMQPSDNALGLNTPSFAIPTSGYVAGISWRTSANITAGGMNPIITINNSNVLDWNDPIMNGGNATSGAYGSALGALPDYITFAAGDRLGMQIQTTAGWTQTTLDVFCIAWIVMDYYSQTSVYP